MALSTRLIVFACLMLTTFAFDRVSAQYQCCDFFYYCIGTWDTVSWKFAPGETPDITNYSGFNLYRPDDNYMWLEDNSGSVSTTNTITIADKSTVISFDYYFYTADPLPQTYLHLMLKQGINLLQLVSITEAKDQWRHAEVVCGDVDCCGSADPRDYPCTGTLQVVGSLDVDYNMGLFAIDNLGVCGDFTTIPPPPPTTTPPPPPPTTTSIPTTTPPTTTPPTTTPPTTTIPTTTPTPYTLPPPLPTPSQCCDFTSNVCGFSSSPATTWYWSYTMPTASIPPYDGNYLWANQNGARVISEFQANFPTSFAFAVTYFLSDPYSSIELSFESSSGSTISLPALTYESYGWHLKTIENINFCPTSTCSGNLIFTASSTSFPFEVAIDNVEFDGHCGGSLPCCYFDDGFFCGFSPLPGPIEWEWTGSDGFPTYPIPTPTSGSDYMYVEVATQTTVAYNASLVSETITISNNAQFLGHFYVKVPDDVSTTEQLEIYFHETTYENPTFMNYIKSTYDDWMDVPFNCKSEHGLCCQEGSTASCMGYIEFRGVVFENQGPLFYAIDAIDMNNQCTTFPGLTVIDENGQSSFVRLHRK